MNEDTAPNLNLDQKTPRSLRNERRGTILRSIGTLLAIALLVYLLSQQGWGVILTAIREIPLWRFGVALVLIIISRLAVTARWHALLRSAGLQVTYWQILRVTFAGLFASNFLPTTIGGDVVRLAGAIQLKLDVALSTASLIVDRLVGMAGMAVAVPFGLPSLIAHRAELFSQAHFTLAASTLVPVNKWQQIASKLWQKLLGLVRSIFGALALWIKQPRALAASLVYNFIHMLCLFYMIALFLNGMGEHLPILVIGGLYSMAYFVTLLPISINGYGLQELSITLIFSTLAGVSVEHSLTAALLFRTIMMLASLPGALFLPGMISNQTPVSEQ